MRKFLMVLMSVLTFTLLSGCGSDDGSDKKEEPKAECDCAHCPTDCPDCPAGCDGDSCACDHGDGACTDCGDNCMCGEGCQCGDNCQCGDSTATDVSAQAIQPFELTNMNAAGAVYRSVDHPASVFLIENYFLTCPYCNDNAPNVHSIQQDYVTYPQVQVLDVGIDRTDRQYDQWIARHSPAHPVLKDDSRVLTNQLGTTGFPSAYIIDCHMNVVYKTTGVWNASTKAAIKSKIDELMAMPCPLAVSQD